MPKSKANIQPTPEKVATHYLKGLTLTAFDPTPESAADMTHVRVEASGDLDAIPENFRVYFDGGVAQDMAVEVLRDLVHAIAGGQA